MILGKLLNIGVKHFSSSGGATLSLGDTDAEFEEEKAVAVKLETKLQGVIKSLDKEIKARRGKASGISTHTIAFLTKDLLPTHCCLGFAFAWDRLKFQGGRARNR
jgi:hypothetical protein